MTIYQVLQALDGRPDLVAVRPSGKIIRQTIRGAIEQFGRGSKFIHFAPMRSDLMTDDWMVKTMQQIATEAAELAAAVAEQGRA